MELRSGAHNYDPLDVVPSRGEGVWVWDTDGKRYLDCLSAYSAVNQGQPPPYSRGVDRAIRPHHAHLNASKFHNMFDNTIITVDRNFDVARLSISSLLCHFPVVALSSPLPNR